jgi:glycosyltransferase involved in cell wall biosynthesis
MDILVVADNSSDETAEIVRAEGVRVIEHRETEPIGKGYALAFGTDALKMDPPEVVIVLDADCVVARAAVLVAWWKFGRSYISAKTLLAAPVYVLWKIPLYVNMLLRRRVLWTLTELDLSEGGEQS